jgi:uncharacterized protein
LFYKKHKNFTKSIIAVQFVKLKYNFKFMNPTLSKIRIYPIKSLDPVELTSVIIGKRSLLGDRKFAMLNQFGSFINGKATGMVNQLQATYDDQIEHVIFNKRGSNEKMIFNLNGDTNKIESYLSDYFKVKVSIIKNDDGRLMDIPDDSSVTVVAHETLQHLADTLGDSIDTLRLRFRANLEFSNVAPYWEEKLANAASEIGIPFLIGDVKVIGISLRARCNVPPRDPFTGQTDKTFIKRLIESREHTIPAWSQIQKLGSLYHLTVDTFIPDSEVGKQLCIGDSIQLI